MGNEQIMNIACVCFTARGAEESELIRKYFSDKNACFVHLYIKQNGASVSDSFSVIELPMQEWARQRFLDSDAIIFVGACGIAVRSIAPVLASKKEDPAILVVDELGKWVISLVSGHLGGANALTRELAGALGAEPVITTATDLNETFAVDVFAKENRLFIASMERAKEVSAALLDGRPVGLYCRESMLPEGIFPAGLDLLSPESAPYIPGTMQERPVLGISISLDEHVSYFEKTLNLVPRCVVLGIGCKKGISPKELDDFLCMLLESKDISLHSVFKVCSIDRKQNEEAIVHFCEKYKLHFETFTAQQLARVPGHFHSSGFVKSIVGVDNVSERSAVLGAMTENLPGKLILHRFVHNGMTAAAAIASETLHF